MAYGTVSADIIQSSVPGVSLGAGNASIMKNRIINGAMGIAQRGTSTSITSNGQFCSVDRFRTYTNGTWGTGTFTATQSSSAPTGFSNSLGITITATDALSTSTASYIIGQTIEGNNTYDLGYGTANAKTVTLSFWVQSSLTGTFGGVIQNNAGNYSYPFSYTISSANTWTQISVTIAGPTTGTWLTGTSGSIYVYWSLGANSSLLAAAGSWTSTANISGATGQTNIISTNGATFYITGVQLEVGSSATGFEYRQYGQELALCQRYFYKAASGLGASGLGEAFAAGTYYNTAQISAFLNFPVTMRTAPTLYYTSVAGYYRFDASNTSVSFSTLTTYYVAATGTMIYNASTSGTQGNGGIMSTTNASSYIGFTAEL